jgi:hypothetical protein
MKVPQRCYICGIELVPVPTGHAGRLQDDHATRDHVPPEGFFCDPKPSNLISVPCCHKHNRKHSGVDERLRMVAALELRRNEGGERVLFEKVFGSTLKKLRQPRFAAQVAESLRDETVITARGPMPVVAFSTSAKEFLDCVADITRGLLATFHPEFDYHGHHFMVLDFHSATLAKGGADQQLKVIRDMVTKTKGDHRGNFNEFRFWRQVEPENGRGAWLLVFYEAVAFSVIHTKIPLEAVLAEHLQGITGSA